MSTPTPNPLSPDADQEPEVEEQYGAQTITGDEKKPPRSQRGDRSPGMTPDPDWQEMSDPEIMGRLLRRGAEPVAAKGWIRDREHSEEAQERIGEFLDAEYKDEEGKPFKFEHAIDRRVRR